MYQSVEQPQDSPVQDESELTARRVWRLAGIAVIALVLMTLFIAVLQSRGQGAGDDTTSETERGSYYTAITEPTKALRRARLQDYIERYPDSPQRQAASAQLDVLTAYETKAWSSLAETVYDANLERDDKLSAIASYERDWGASYLGGREEELMRLKGLVGDKDLPTPDRNLDNPSTVPNSIDGNTMAGGPVIIAPPPVITAPQPPVITAPPVSVMPKIKRNAKPKYPKRDLRNDIEATVELSLSINAEGKVESSELVFVRAEKYEKNFVKAAKRAAKRTRYEPYMVNGSPRPLSGISKRYQFRIAQEN